MTDDERPARPGDSPSGWPGREAGFCLTRPELEALAAAELKGVVTDPKLLSNSGLWATFQAREPCCEARVLLNIHAREGLDDRTVNEVLRAAGRGRDLRHPSVLSTRRFGCTDDVVWVTTRAYRGRLMRLPSPSEPAAGRSRVLEFLRRVADPLDAAHRDGLVHGALSDATFHCDTNGHVRIRNLGFDVPLLRGLHRSGVRTATTACAAPEVLAGSDPKTESDQYALAALLLRAVTGHPPASDGTFPWNDIPDDMRSALRRALRPDGEARFPGIVAMWEALDPETAGAARTRGRDVRPPRPDEEVPGAPSDASLAPAEGDTPRERAAERLRHGPPPSPRRAGPHGSPPDDRARASEQEPAPGGRWTRPSDDGWAPFRGRRGKSRRRAAGAWARAGAAAAVLVLFFGTLELVGEWSRISPFVAPLDSLLTAMISTARLPGGDEPLPGAEPSGPDRSNLGAVPPDTDPSLDLTAEPERAAAGSHEAESDGNVDGLAGLDETAGESVPPTPDEMHNGSSPARDAQREEPASTPASDVASTPAPDEPPNDPVLTPASNEARETPVRGPMSLEVAAAGTSMSGAADNRYAAPGLLSLQSYPWGRVYLDGDFIGNSPIIEMRVSAGQHEIRIERARYLSHVETITVLPGRSVRRTGIVLSPGGA